MGQVSCWPFGPRGFKSHPGRLFLNAAMLRRIAILCPADEETSASLKWIEREIQRHSWKKGGVGSTGMVVESGSVWASRFT